jgi:hypothetical protein
MELDNEAFGGRGSSISMLVDDDEEDEGHVSRFRQRWNRFGVRRENSTFTRRTFLIFLWS